MLYIACWVAMILWLRPVALAGEEPAGLLDAVLAQVRQDLARLPDYVCLQSTDRFTRSSAEQAWERADTLRFEVAVTAKRELYSPPGAQRFQDRPLADMVGKGVVGAGQVGTLARLVFAAGVARFTYKGLADGLHQWEYEVPLEKSSYRVRSGTEEAGAAIQGAFWVEAASRELKRLEVAAYDIPERIGIAELVTTMNYARVAIEDSSVLLPLGAELRMAKTDGVESLNRSRLSSCRQFQAESTIRYAGQSEAAPEPARPGSTSAPLPDGALLEVALEADVDPATAQVGDAVQARLVRAVRDGESTLAGSGLPVIGRIVRLDRQAMPTPLHEIGLELEALHVDGRPVPVNATMIEAGPAAGLVRQAKRLNPVFDRKRRPGIQMLVREVQRGQGILLWEAHRGPLPRGLKMKWRVQSDADIEP